MSEPKKIEMQNEEKPAISVGSIVRKKLLDGNDLIAKVVAVCEDGSFQLVDHNGNFENCNKSGWFITASTIACGAFKVLDQNIAVGDIVTPDDRMFGEVIEIFNMFCIKTKNGYFYAKEVTPSNCVLGHVIEVVKVFRVKYENNIVEDEHVVALVSNAEGVNRIQKRHDKLMKFVQDAMQKLRKPLSDEESAKLIQKRRVELMKIAQDAMEELLLLNEKLAATKTVAAEPTSAPAAK